MSMPKIDISSIVSILLVIALAFTSMGSMTANIEDKVSFDANVTLDAEALMATFGLTTIEGLPESVQKQLEEQKQTFKAIGDIISSLTLRGVAGKDAAEAVILAGDSAAISIGMKKDDTGVTVASNLLPSDVIFISDEMIQKKKDEMEEQKQQAQEMQQMFADQAAAAAGEGQTAAVQSAAAGVDSQAIAEALEKLDKDQIAKDIEEAINKLNEGIEAKKGETETGEFTVDGLTFVSKTPINMTYPEFAEFLLTGVKELASRESLKPLIDATGKDIGAEIDKAIEELKNQPESDYPETFELAVYTDADNCTYSVSDLARESSAGREERHIALGEIEGQSRAKFICSQGNEKVTVNAVGTKDGALDLTANIESKMFTGAITANRDEAENLNITCNINDGKQEAKIVVIAGKAEGDRTNFQLEVYLGDAGKPMIAFNGSFGKGGELISVFEGEKMNVIPAEKLMDGASTEATTLGIKLLAGVMKSLVVVTKNVPEETADWINARIKELMSPKPAVTEVPQTEPVVDGE